MRSTVLLLALLLPPLLYPAPYAQAQTSPEQEVRAVVDRLFDGMRQGDSTIVRSVFHPEARLMSVSLRQGEPVLRIDSVDAFVRAVGTPRAQAWDERISNVQIQVDGALASAWMDYAFYRSEQFSHCGANAFQFFRTQEGWRIIQITDTRRREGCPEQQPPA